MRFKKDKTIAKEAVKVTGRAMNQIVGALRQVDYTNNSEQNMLLIDGMVRTLAYINASRHLALYFNTRIPDMSKRYHFEKKKTDKSIRKLKAQREYREETYPPVRWQHIEECDLCKWYDPTAYRCCIGGGVGCYYEPKLPVILVEEEVS